MKAKSQLWMFAVVTVSLLIISRQHTTEAKKLTLHPLTARQIYRLLRTTENEDVVPKGRIVTQGLAALTGFTLGITKGTGRNTGTGTTGGNEMISQEICFNSRSARNLQEAEAIAEAYSRLDNNRDGDKVRSSETQRLVRPNHRNKRVHDRRSNSHNQAMIDETKQAVTDVGTTSTDLGTSTSPTSSDTTSTILSEPPAINCIVLNKPKQ